LVVNQGLAALFAGGGAGGTDPSYPKVGVYSGQPGNLAVPRRVRHANMQHSNKSVYRHLVADRLAAG
jgi:hypothetical protein